MAALAQPEHAPMQQSKLVMQIAKDISVLADTPKLQVEPINVSQVEHVQHTSELLMNANCMSMPLEMVAGQLLLAQQS